MFICVLCVSPDFGGSLSEACTALVRIFAAPWAMLASAMLTFAISSLSTSPDSRALATSSIASSSKSSASSTEFTHPLRNAFVTKARFSTIDTVRPSRVSGALVAWFESLSAMHLAYQLSKAPSCIISPTPPHEARPQGAGFRRGP